MGISKDRTAACKAHAEKTDWIEKFRQGGRIMDLPGEVLVFCELTSLWTRIEKCQECTCAFEGECQV